MIRVHNILLSPARIAVRQYPNPYRRLMGHNVSISIVEMHVVYRWS